MAGGEALHGQLSRQASRGDLRDVPDQQHSQFCQTQSEAKKGEKRIYVGSSKLVQNHRVQGQYRIIFFITVIIDLFENVFLFRYNHACKGWEINYVDYL